MQPNKLGLEPKESGSKAPVILIAMLHCLSDFLPKDDSKHLLVYSVLSQTVIPTRNTMEAELVYTWADFPAPNASLGSVSLLFIYH